MPIDFHDARNRQTYATRDADESWITFIRDHIEVSNKRIADAGCGGGIYTRALARMGAAHVVGIDFSEEMLKGATESCRDMPNVTFHKGDACQSGLPADEFDIILERALIHHLHDLDACFREAHRMLKAGGVLIVQDRTPQDCLLPGDEHHIRGYFFEKFPRLGNLEISRRHDSDQVRQALERSGFRLDKTGSLWEISRIYPTFDELAQDLLRRTGRSILHELTDGELQELVDFMRAKLRDCPIPIVEKDSWTVWFAIKP